MLPDVTKLKKNKHIWVLRENPGGYAHVRTSRPRPPPTRKEIAALFNVISIVASQDPVGPSHAFPSLE